MISIFPTPYPDEHIYNIFIRYHKLSGNVLLSKTQESLFGKKERYLRFNFPSYLQHLCDQLYMLNKFIPEYLIENHTIFPFYLPFISEKKRRKSLEIMKYGSNKAVETVLGTNYLKNFNVDKIRVCLECIDNDNKKYGEAYIHRKHQIPGNFICNIHNSELFEVNKRIKYGLSENIVDINDRNICFNKLLNDNEDTTLYIELSRSIDVLFNDKSDLLTEYEVKRRYTEEFMKKGYKKPSGFTLQIELYKDIMNFFDKNSLIRLNSYIDIKDKNNINNWIRKITDNSDRSIYPIQHLILIIFLFGGIEGFINFEKKSNLLGKPPWPCLNSICKDYRKKVINKCIISRDSNGYYQGEFKCDCGFTYIRKNKDNLGTNIYHYDAIKEVGAVWEEYLKDKLVNYGYSINRLS